jgi:hypothetical protein
MKKTTLLLAGTAVLAGAAAYLIYSKRKQTIEEPASETDNGYVRGEKRLRRALHKAKVAAS